MRSLFRLGRFSRRTPAALLLGMTMLLHSEGLDAQQPGSPPQRQAPRRSIAVLELTSPAFADGARIPDRHAQVGRDVSPPLAWRGVPDSVGSFVLVVRNLDAATGNGTDDTLHWLVWNIPAATRDLPAGLPAVSTLPDGSRQISVSGPYYRGPAAGRKGRAHHFVFELYAIDRPLDVPAVGASPANTRAAVLSAMAGMVRAKGVLVATH